MPRWLLWTLLTLFSWGIWAVLFRLIGGQLSEAPQPGYFDLGGPADIGCARALTKDAHPRAQSTPWDPVGD